MKKIIIIAALVFAICGIVYYVKNHKVNVDIKSNSENVSMKFSSKIKKINS